MANTKKPDENNQLAKGIPADAPQGGDRGIITSFIPTPETISEGGIVVLEVTLNFDLPSTGFYTFKSEAGDLQEIDTKRTARSTIAHWDTKGLRSSSYKASVEVFQAGFEQTTPILLGTDETRIIVLPREVQAAVTLQRSAVPPTDDQALWVAIRNRTDAISFDRYDTFINRLLCPEGEDRQDLGTATCRRGDGTFGVGADSYGAPTILDIRNNLTARPNIYGPDAYYLLKLAAQAFLIFESGIVIDPRRKADTGEPDFDQPVPGLEDPESRLGRPVTPEQIRGVLAAYLGTVVGTVGGRGLPYLKRIVNALIPAADSRDERLPYCGEILQHRFSCPSLLELIWSYWEEEGMLVQTVNAIARRFQNRSGGPRDPLANLELDPLRPLNNLLWGFIQDEYNRLTVPRRAYEYDHHYGLMLVGKAVPKLTSADSRSKFITAFHNLLNRAAIFFKADSDTTLVAGLSAAECPQGGSSRARRGGSQPVRRPALDGAGGDAQHAVVAVPDRDPGVPARTPHGALSGDMDGGGR